MSERCDRRRGVSIERRNDGFRWHLDPIDGTQSFIRGVPLFGTMVALERGDDAVIGVIAFPALGEIVYAAKGRGAWWATNANEAKRIGDLDRRPARVSKTDKLPEAALSNGGLELFPQLGMHDGFERLVAKTKMSRGWCDCYGHYLVATGRIDVMVDPEMHVWGQRTAAANRCRSRRAIHRPLR